MSADNNPMVLVELTGLSYRYGTTIYAVDSVNGTMYGRFSGGFRIINERATLELQYRGASLAGMYGPAQPIHMSTLPGMTQMVTPLAEYAPVTQTLQMPTVPGRIPPVQNILEPTSNEQARANYLERQMRQMSSISGLPSNMPPLEDIPTQKLDEWSQEVISEEEYNRNRNQQEVGIIVHDSLQEQVQNYCWGNKVRRKQECKSHRMALERMKEDKEQQRQQQSQEEKMQCMLKCYRTLNELELL